MITSISSQRRSPFSNFVKILGSGTYSPRFRRSLDRIEEPGEFVRRVVSHDRSSGSYIATIRLVNSRGFHSIIPPVVQPQAKGEQLRFLGLSLDGLVEEQEGSRSRILDRLPS